MYTINEATLHALKYYKQFLIDKKVKSADCTASDPTKLEHLLWMCEHQIKILETDLAGNVYTANRWLGYIQGVLITKGLTTVEEERNRTRPWFKNGKTDSSNL